MRLEGKQALVTGGSLGIGRAIALAYAKEGANLVITGRHRDTLEPVAEDIRSTGCAVHVLEWDVSWVEQADERLDEVVEMLGGLDVVVNNAGVLRRDGTGFPELTEGEWDYVMGVNLKGLYFVCQAAVRRMKARGGVIINIASDAGLRAAVNPYGLSKWGVVGLTKGMAKACAADGIRVNAIAPGPVATRMMGWEPGKPVENDGLPLGRMAYPREVADVAVFLASDQAAAVIGQVIPVNSATAI